MRQNLLNSIRLRIVMIVAVMCTLGMQVWGQTAAVNDVLWTEPFTGTNTSSSFSATSSWGTYTSPTTLVAADASSLSYSSSNAMLSSTSATNMTSAHVWLNKSVESYIQVTGIKLYNATKVKVSWSQATSGSLAEVYYQFDGTGSFSKLSSCSGPNAKFESDELSVSDHTTIALKFIHPQSNGKNTRIDNLTLTVTEISASSNTPCSTPTFSPAAGTYTSAQSVTISTETAGANIYYTTDGSTPSSSNGTVYSSAITVSSSQTIKAIAVKDGNSDSEVATAAYTITSAVATTTTINSTGITNTDVYTSTAAGSLSATVTPSGSSALSNPVITWSSSDTDVATVAADGTVTLVAAGTTTITASYAGVTDTYQASSASYELTVTSSAPYVQPTSVTAIFNNTNFGTTTGNNAEEQSYTIDNIVIQAGCTSSASSKTYYDTGHVRFYAGSYLILTAPTGYSISKIEFTANGTWNGGITPNSGTYNNSTKTWTGSVSSLRFDFTAQNRIATASITLIAAGSAVTTTTAISAASITNTDVYISTAAGSLAATVTPEGGSALSNPSITWSGDNDNVATINASTGAVTLVAAGTVTFTATYAGESGEYLASSDTYEMTVTSSAPYVQPTEIEITPNYEFWGKTESFSNTTYDDLSGSQDNVSLEWERGSGSTYANTTAMRFYKDNNLTFTAPSGYEIKSIVLTMSSAQTDFTFSPEGYDTESTTWTGSSATVTMSRPSDASSYAQITKLTITIGLPSSVTTPTFTVASGEYLTAQNVKVGNYDQDYMYFYTTDGTNPDCDANLDPTGTSVSYSHASGINVSTTTTLKIIAVDEDGNKSAVATAEYTFPTIYTTIADFKTANTTGYLNLTGAQVVYIDSAKKNIYVRDASGAVDLFNNSSFTTSLTTGDILSGTIYGKYSPYKNLPEIINITDISVLTATSNQTVVAKVIEGTTEAIAANLCDLVKIENTEITESSSKYYVGDNSDIQLYDNFSVGYTITTGQPVDVSGIATVYNTTYELFPRVNEDIVYLATSEPVSITSSLGYSTFASENALDFTATDAIKVFYATVSGSTLSFTQIYKVPANTGVLLFSAEGGAVAATNVPYLTGAADDVTGNVFVKGTGAAVSYAADNQNYILFIGDDGLGFYQANNNTVAANRAYIHIDGGNGVKSFSINLDAVVDGIKAIDNGQCSMDNVIYNLAGQRMSKMQKGINIINGKKVLVK